MAREGVRAWAKAKAKVMAMAMAREKLLKTSCRPPALREAALLLLARGGERRSCIGSDAESPSVSLGSAICPFAKMSASKDSFSL